ncbi:MAG: hypothetical protein NC223_05585 [Butyrivibrio sp.]|nr:hypothetical protein [Butyrivibrio sp.]
MLEEFHKRRNTNGIRYELKSLRFGKRCCSDDANLCEVIEISTGGSGAQNDEINRLLQKSRFDTQYRRQLEQVPAVGTAAAYIRLENADLMRDGTVKNGNIVINYVDADGYIPLTVTNNVVTEAAFSGSDLSEGKKHTTLVVFTKSGVNYRAQTFGFNEYGEEIDSEGSVLTLGEVCPFAVMRNAEVNNIDNMDGYGLPKLYNAIPILMGLDLAYNVLFSDLEKAEKLLIINEVLCEFDKDGKRSMTPEQKKLFVMLGEKLPEQKELIYEYNPIVRINEMTETIKLLLSLLSMMFGYGTKKYNFENGQITTATEYIGERQDQMQELNRQRKESVQYIRDICRAVMWFSNNFNKSSYDIDAEIMVDFDDSYVVDRESELERKRNDAQTFDIPILLLWYIMDAYNLSEEEAKKYIAEGTPEQETEEPEED